MDRKRATAAKFGVYRHEKLLTEARGESSNNRSGDELFVPRRRNHYTIIFSGYAGALHFVDNKMLQIPAYSVLFIGPDRLSHFHREIQPNTHILTFSDLFYSRNPKDAHFIRNSLLFHNFDAAYLLTPPSEALDYIRGLIVLLYETQDRFEEEIYRDLAHNIVQHILIVGTTRHHRTQTVSFKENIDNILVLKFRELLDRHFVDERSVRFYTDRLHVTDRRLNLATKSILDLSAKEVITRKVMDEARWKLTYTAKTIKEIAAELGFKDEYYFSSFFLRNEGVRPKVFQSENNFSGS